MGAFSGVLDGVENILRIFREEMVHAEPGRPWMWKRDLSWMDLCVAVVAAVVTIAFRMVIQNRVVPSLCFKFSKLKQRKIGENVFYTVMYLLSFLAGMAVLGEEAVYWRVDLFSNEKMTGFWESIADQGFVEKLPEASPLVRWYYLIVGGFWLGCAVFHVALDTRRSDFMEYVIHHFSTLLLIGVSYCLGYVRFGLVILPLHDITDIFLYGAKTIHYLGLKGFDTFVFLLFSVSFYVTRLVMFPRLVLGVALEPFVILAKDPLYNDWARYWPIYISEYVIILSALLALQLLHCFWFSLIAKMLRNELRPGQGVSDKGDARSDDEDEE